MASGRFRLAYNMLVMAGDIFRLIYIYLEWPAADSDWPINTWNGQRHIQIGLYMRALASGIFRLVYINAEWPAADSYWPIYACNGQRFTLDYLYTEWSAADLYWPILAIYMQNGQRQSHIGL